MAMQEHGYDAQKSIKRLSIWESDSHCMRQMVWDGNRLSFVPPLGDTSSSKFAEEAIGRGRALSPRRLRYSVEKNIDRVSSFLDAALVPRDVSPSYWRYMKWKFIQRAVSSFMQVFATQSLLRGLSLSSSLASSLTSSRPSSTLPLASTLNWVLKDGIGRLGRLSFASSAGHTFDSRLKQVRFATSVGFTLALGLDMATPFFPAAFLPLATVANVGKSIGLAAYLATAPAIHKCFALGENLADISAKGQAQTVLADNLGLGLAVLIGTALHKHHRAQALLPLLLYPPLAALDLAAIRQELRAVPLATLNQERLEILADAWLCSLPLLSPCAMAEHGEKLMRLPGWMRRGRRATRGNGGGDTADSPTIPIRVTSLLAHFENAAQVEGLLAAARHRSPSARLPKAEEGTGKEEDGESRRKEMRTQPRSNCSRGRGWASDKEHGMQNAVTLLGDESFPQPNTSSSIISTSSGSGRVCTLYPSHALTVRRWQQEVICWPFIGERYAPSSPSTGPIQPAQCRATKGEAEILLSFHSSSTPQERICAVLQAAKVRRAMELRHESTLLDSHSLCSALGPELDGKQTRVPPRQRDRQSEGGASLLDSECSEFLSTLESNGWQTRALILESRWGFCISDGRSEP